MKRRRKKNYSPSLRIKKGEWEIIGGADVPNDEGIISGDFRAISDKMEEMFDWDIHREAKGEHYSLGGD